LEAEERTFVEHLVEMSPEIAVENKSLGWIEARRRAEIVINNCEVSASRFA